MLHWKRIGHVFDPTELRPRPWMQEYAQCPTPFLLDDNTVRVIVSCRPKRDSDLQYVAHPGYVDLDRNNLTRVVGISEQPILDLGGAGMFDEFGIMPSSIVRTQSEMLLYYTGWTRMDSLPYTLAIGVARSVDGGRTFSRIGAGPTLNVGLHEPYFVTGPFVLPDGPDWQMWYLSCRRWIYQDGKPEPIYRVAHATSGNGLDWDHTGTEILPTLSSNECQDMFAPFFSHGQWHAVFAFRDPGIDLGRYRLGYAHSKDLANWERNDSLVGFERSTIGWDSEMMCYPQLFDLDGRQLVFYCGNQFGAHGFGIAELTHIS